MIETKREIILEEGIPVEIFNKDGESLFETTALIGKATRQFFSEISLESHRQGQFLPELDIHNGLIVENKVTNDDYIIVANYPEIIERQKCTIITRMIVCNSQITVSRLVRTADKFGNIKKDFEDVYKDLSVYAEPIDSEVKQTDPGKLYKTKYNIYAPNLAIDIEDRLELEVGGEKKAFKLDGYDSLTFKGLTIIEVTTDTRRE